MRCRICDWSPGLPGSLLRPSLASEPVFIGPPEPKDWDPVSETYQCSHCCTKPTAEPVDPLISDWPIPEEVLSDDQWKYIGDNSDSIG